MNQGYFTFSHPLGLTDDQKGKYELGTDEKPFTTLSYANGPGSYAEINATVRPDLTTEDTGIITHLFIYCILVLYRSDSLMCVVILHVGGLLNDIVLCYILRKTTTHLNRTFKEKQTNGKFFINVLL